ncbi:MAG: 23S rRNA (adenine(2503)-C(2))-methyltransferase RlmN, partial [Ilumatobacteraceae bacterium]
MTAGAASTRYDLTRIELGELLGGEPRFRVDQIWKGLYMQLADPAGLTNVPKALRARLEADLPPALMPVDERVSDNGDTVKYVFELRGGSRIETVLMLYPDRVTACVSSQAGCAMGCGFCATGQAGFTRQLTPGEIIEQVVRAARKAKELDRRLANVVFMGMGEPLANEAAVWASVERIHDDIGLGARHLTISTVGVVPGIRKLAQWPMQVNLAVSLHAANDELRNSMVPINRRYPLAELMSACADYLVATGRRLSFEWALIADTN